VIAFNLDEEYTPWENAADAWENKSVIEPFNYKLRIKRD
jgi:hypothetical protein